MSLIVSWIGAYPGSDLACYWSAALSSVPAFLADRLNFGLNVLWVCLYFIEVPA